MLAEGIFPIGDGLLDIDEERLKGLLVPEDINEIYEVEQTPFARGKFAAVRRAIHKKSGVHFAAKFLKRRRRAQSSDKEIKHEIAVLMLCNDADNIVKLNAVHETRSDTALLLELATGGELQTFLDNEECLSEPQARICMREVLKALQFLHKRSIAHLDLKPQNILLAGERIEDGLKLCDFGISRVVADGTNVREILGTPDYVAPEVLQYEPLSLLTDIWSVGVLTYVLLSGFSPFGGETKQETFLNISQCSLTFPDKLFGGVSSAAIDFIRKALRIKPNDRMSAAGCLEHIWLKDECNIDRHIFNNITATATNKVVDHDDDIEDDDDDDIDDDNEIDDIIEHHNEKEQDIIEAISIDNSDEEEEQEEHLSLVDKLKIPTPNGRHHHTTNGCENGFKTTNVHHQPPTHTPQRNGHTNGHTNGHAHGLSSSATGTLNGTTPGHFTKSPLEEVNEKCSSTSKIMKSTTSTTTKTTAVHNMPQNIPMSNGSTTKSITIPLQQTQHQAHPPNNERQYMPARRHSSESNKENSFLATKLISPSTNATTTTLLSTMAVIKKPTNISQTTATATIVIASGQNCNSNSNTTTNHNNIVATITLPQAVATAPTNCSFSSCSTPPRLMPNGNDNYKLIHKSSTASPSSLFPDAPTTPKVIRKAPATDTSPTSSVKALVKKFQLEQGEQPITPPEFATNGSKQPCAAKTIEPAAVKQKYCTGRLTLSPTPTSNNTQKAQSLFSTSCSSSSLSSSRRASEPITAIHSNGSKRLGSNASNIMSTSAPVSVPPSSSNSYKTTCVYCYSCNHKETSGDTTATNGCRHSSNVKHSNSNLNHLNGSLSSSSSSSNKSLLLMNGSTSNGSLTSTASNATINANSNSALLFANSTAATAAAPSSHHHLLSSSTPHHNHHHHQLHHHHHHGVVKSAAATANGLSLDQGIIC